MTDARERIAEIFKSTLEFDGVVYNADQTIDAILSALPSIVREMIPDLEFNDGDGLTSYAKSEFGLYSIWPEYFRPPNQSAGIPAGDPEKAANEHHKQQILKAMGMSE